MKAAKALAISLAALVLCLSPSGLKAGGCPSEPDWSYTGAKGPQNWNSLFPTQCGNGSRQSPFDIVTASAQPAPLPPLTFHYRVADVLVLDHDGQVRFGHGVGNFLTIAQTRYNLINIHDHTPSEYTLNGQRFPMEIHLVHQDPNTGQLAVVGVFVNAGNADPGVVAPPSLKQPSTVDLKLTDLIPAKKSYLRFNGSLTTPGTTTKLPRCAEGVVWTEMLTPIVMSKEQIAAFEDASEACWGTKVTNRPPQPTNGRFLLAPIGE